MLNKPLLGLTVAAVLMVQIACVASHWRAIEDQNVDFASLLGASRLLHEGSKPNYDPDHLRVDLDPSVQSAGKSALAQPDILHPPFESLMFFPLLFFPYLTAFVIWTILNLIMYWSVPFLLRDFLPRLHSEAYWLAILYGTFLPALICLMFGQDSILLLFLIALSLDLLAAKHDTRAGFILALGLFKFQIILPIFLLLVAIRRRNAVYGFICGFFSLMIAAVAMIGPGEVLRYARFMFAVSRHISTNASTRTVLMPNLRGLISLALGNVTQPKTQSLVIIALAALLLGTVLIWTDRFRNYSLRVCISMAVVTASLISYHYYIYNAVILVIPILLMANEFAFVD